MEDKLESKIALFETAEAGHILAQAVGGSFIAPDAFTYKTLRTGGTLICSGTIGEKKLNRVSGLTSGCLSFLTATADQATKDRFEADLDDAEVAFRHAGVPGFLMIVAADPKDEQMADGLEVVRSAWTKKIFAERKYTVSSAGLVDVLGYNLQDIVAKARIKNDPWQYVHNGIHIRHVREAEHDRFIDASVEGFASGGQNVDLLRMLAKIAVRRTQMDTELFFAFDESQRLLGSAGMAIFQVKAEGPETKGSVAEFYIDSTLPRARGKGVHAALIGARLERAKELDCSWAKMEAWAGDGSVKNAKRCGFERVLVKTVLQTPQRWT